MTSLFEDQQAKKPLAPPTRPASDMWDREGALNKALDADAENPALSKKRGSSGGGRAPSPTDGKPVAADGSALPPDHHHRHDSEHEPRCTFYKKGWFWGIVVVATIVCIAAPVGVATQKRIDAEGMNPGALTPKSASGTYSKWSSGSGGGGGGGPAAGLLFDPVSGTFSAAGGNRTVDVSKLTCAELEADMPAGPAVVPEGRPPAPLASAGDLPPAGPDALDGATWPGFDDGRTTFFAGLSAASAAGDKDGSSSQWASGDLASAAYTLRAAGAKAVRVPFAFTDLFTLPPRQAAFRCSPSPAPDAISLADAVGASPKDEQSAALARPIVTGQGAEYCNAYVPAAAGGGGGMAPSTLPRFLHAVQTLVESGHYVVLAYAPPGGAAGGEAVVESPESLAASWGRLWAALSCLPGYSDRLAGRVLVEPLATPRANGIRWGKEEEPAGKNDTAAAAASSAPPLAEYYSAAVAAIEARAEKEADGRAPMYVLSGTDAQVSGFAQGKRFAPRVVSSAALYSPSSSSGSSSSSKGPGGSWMSKTEGVLSAGPRSWAADATERTGAAAAAAAKKQMAAAGGGTGPAPGTVAAARAANRKAAQDGVAPIETGRRRHLMMMGAATTTA
jgi:hypothetical protein